MPTHGLVLLEVSYSISFYYEIIIWCFYFSSHFIFDNGIHNLACNFLYDFVNATPRYFTKHLYPQLQQSNTMSSGRWRKFLLPIGTLNLDECQVIRNKISSRYQRTCKDRLVTRACVMPRGLTILFAKKKQIKTNTGVAFGRFFVSG